MASVIDRCIEPISRGERPNEADAISILHLVKSMLLKDRNVLYLHSPLVICGDIHGQLDDLHKLFVTSGDMTSQRYLFLGDFVDRGYHSLCTFLYLVCLKLKHPQRFFLLRGNHESRTISHQYGFYSECSLQYGHDGIFNLCNEVFDVLPYAAVIDRTVFAVHGGLSPFIPLIPNIDAMKREEEVPQSGGLADLVWSDPENVQVWRPGGRGVGYIFGQPQVMEFCRLNKVNLVVRSHQLAQDGFQWWFQRDGTEPKGSALAGQLLLVWSAPNYAYTSGNKASVCKYGFTETGELEMKLFEANTERIPQTDPTSNHYFS
jgi:diadenosine tetraphosphatase ApaH/serine/threonine PP2A family protein phosphatase